MTENEKEMIPKEEEEMVEQYAHITKLFEQTILLLSQSIQKIVNQRRHNVLSELIESSSKLMIY